MSEVNLKMYECLKHLSDTCEKNNDGSLSLGTCEVEMIEAALETGGGTTQPPQPKGRNEMSEVNELMESGTPYVYVLDITKQRKHETGALVAPVSIVFENVAGHFPTGSGGEGSAPWFWSQEICDEKNAELGHSVIEVFKIVDSSMRWHPRSMEL